MANKIRYITSDGRIEYADAPLIKPIDVAGEEGFGVYHSPIVVTPTGVYRSLEVKPRFFSEEVADLRDAAEIRRKQADEKVKLMFSGKEYAKLGGLTLAGATAAGLGAVGLSTLPGTVAGNFIGDATGSMALGMGLEEGQRAAFGKSAGDIVYSQLKPYIGEFAANMARPEYIISPSMVLKNTYTLATNNLGKLYADQTVKLVKKPSKNVLTQNALSSHLLGEEAVKMFKQYGGVEIPEGSINGQLLRMYVPEARERYGLVGNTNITDEEIARALYKHSLELGQGTAAKNAIGEPLLLFRGNTKDVPIFRHRKAPELFVELSGTMDNSLGTLFLGELPNKNGDSGVYRYLVRGNDRNGNFNVYGAGAGNEAKPIINGEITQGTLGKLVAKFPEGTRKVISYPRYSLYKLPPNASSTGYNAVDAYIVRTPAVRDMTNEMETIPGNPNEFEVKPFEWLVPKEQRLGLTEREVLGKQYLELLNLALINNQGLLKSNKGTIWRGDEHAAYDYFALPNFNLQNIKHLLPYDLRIPRNWNDPNVYRAIIPVGVTTYGITNNN